MKRTILIVDDEEPGALLLEVALESIAGVVIRLARDGRQALDMMADENSGICALITDLQLPLADGFQLLAAARGRFPVIVVSGDPDPRTPDRVRKLGASAFFSKPYSPAQVRQTLEALLRTGGIDHA